MKLLSLSVTGMVWRLYLMMALVIIAGFTGLWFLALLALPVFLSALIGIEFSHKATVKKPKLSGATHKTKEQHHTAH